MTNRRKHKVKIITDTECIGMMPNQIYGFIDESPFYWRARWGKWTLEINDEEVLSGNAKEAGWWYPYSRARAACRRHIRRYLSLVNKR